MILEIDYGNTRLKWRVLDAKSSVVIAKGSVFDAEQLISHLSHACYDHFVFGRMCSVRSSADNEKIAVLLKSRFGLTVQLACSQHQLAGVTSAYEYAQSLGVDRWLAIVAAYAKVQDACVVIDCGTAITVDYLSKEGVHLGGYIAPGLRLLSGVLKDCSGLSAEKYSTDEIGYELGVNTQGCMNAGIKTMAIGFIKEALTYGQVKLAYPFTVVCTGGDASLVTAVHENAVMCGDLVFDGLVIACPYNVEK